MWKPTTIKEHIITAAKILVWERKVRKKKKKITVVKAQ